MLTGAQTRQFAYQHRKQKTSFSEGFSNKDEKIFGEKYIFSRKTYKPIYIENPFGKQPEKQKLDLIGDTTKNN